MKLDNKISVQVPVILNFIKNHPNSIEGWPNARLFRCDMTNHQSDGSYASLFCVVLK